MQLQLQGPLMAISDAISQLHAQIRQADEDAQQERQKHGASDPSAASPDDVLILNIGGDDRWRVKRQHMTQGEGVEGTLLATLFSGCWDGRLSKDDKQRVFIDMSPSAFETIHTAILDAETMRSAGKAASVATLLEETSQRDCTGPHGFWIKLLLSPLDKAASEATSSGVTEPQPAATNSPAASDDAVKPLQARVEAIMKAFAKEKARLEAQLRAANKRRDNLDKEIQAVSPFLLPLSGDDDPIRSVDVCGHVITTTQSTVDEMSDELRNRFDRWPRPVEVVQPDHIGRMVDYYRRKRLGASAADMAAVLKMDKPTKQSAFDINAAMYGVVNTDTPTTHGAQQTSGDGFIEMPSGNRYRIVTEGTGGVPTANDRIKYDYIAWRDGFDGREKSIDSRGRVGRVSDAAEWWREAMLSMREGETRQTIRPAKYHYGRYVELRLISIE
ncbi:unnamed protein product [Vitrella brassicaformis CCMP3155]|uniref:Potassium channel tetramerisation-type BTB domain-containing protein n=1 Tax=Vitrella brassicaformis (strain CCMP3155) TaxID=1169540 RepID=A0A0G4GPP1_VITBC|nr:unnamed protein product [Vitrella brassicaformis CCMP3155]|eukprot:CEM32330.1 unnamed protein product [Vitrella brassicaformis CCMP3155]